MGQITINVGLSNENQYAYTATNEILSKYNFNDFLSKYGVTQLNIIFRSSTGDASAYTEATKESGIVTITVNDSIYKGANGEAYVGIEAGPNATIPFALTDVLIHEFTHAAFPGLVDAEFHQNWQNTLNSTTLPMDLSQLLREYIFFGLEASVASQLGLPPSFQEQQKFYAAQKILASEASPLRKEISQIDWMSMSPLDMLEIMRDPTHPIHKFLKIDGRPGIPFFALEQGQYEHCFLAGTQIALYEGGARAIENIKVGDLVSSFEANVDAGRGTLSAGRVKRIFRGAAKTIINLRGLRTTPGHVFLSGDGSMKTISRILQEDGAIVSQAGSLIRARTGDIVDQEKDRMVLVTYEEAGKQKFCGVRAGIPIGLTRRSHSLTTLLDLCRAQGFAILDSGLVEDDSLTRGPVRWPAYSSPFASAVQRDYIVLDDHGLPYSPSWVAELRRLESEDDHSAISMTSAFHRIL